MSDITANNYVGQVFRNIFRLEEGVYPHDGKCSGCQANTKVLKRQSNFFCVDCDTYMKNIEYRDNIVLEKKKWVYKAATTTRLNTSNTFFFLYGDVDNPKGFICSRANMDKYSLGEVEWYLPGVVKDPNAPTHLVKMPTKHTQEFEPGPSQMVAPLLFTVMDYVRDNNIDKFVTGFFFQKSANFQFAWSTPDHLYISADGLYVSHTRGKVNGKKLPPINNGSELIARSARPEVIRDVLANCGQLKKNEFDLMLFNESRLAPPTMEKEMAVWQEQTDYLRENFKQEFRYLTNPKNRCKLPIIGSGDHALIRTVLKD